jgi:hypothetical protein
MALFKHAYLKLQIKAFAKVGNHEVAGGCNKTQISHLCQDRHCPTSFQAAYFHLVWGWTVVILVADNVHACFMKVEI